MRLVELSRRSQDQAHELDCGLDAAHVLSDTPDTSAPCCVAASYVPAPNLPMHPDSCLPLLLPAVEAGLGHEAWRIRQASVELCGELLFKVRPYTACRP